MPVRVYENGQWVEASTQEELRAHERGETHPNYVKRSGDTITGTQTISTPAASGVAGTVIVEGASNNNIRMHQTNRVGSGRNYWLHHDSAGQFYILQDRTGNDSWEATHPLRMPPGENGTLVFDQPPRIGAGQYYGYTMSANTTTTTIPSSTAWTNVYSYTIPALALTQGSRLQVTFVGDHINNSGTTIGVTYRVQYNGVTAGGDNTNWASSSNRRNVRIIANIIHPTSTTFRLTSYVEFSSAVSGMSSISALAGTIKYLTGSVNMTQPMTINLQALYTAAHSATDTRRQFAQVVNWK